MNDRIKILMNKYVTNQQLYETLARKLSFNCAGASPAPFVTLLLATTTRDIILGDCRVFSKLAILQSSGDVNSSFV